MIIDSCVDVRRVCEDAHRDTREHGRIRGLLAARAGVSRIRQANQKKSHSENKTPEKLKPAIEFSIHFISPTGLSLVSHFLTRLSTSGADAPDCFQVPWMAVPCALSLPSYVLLPRCISKCKSGPLSPIGSMKRSLTSRLRTSAVPAKCFSSGYGQICIAN